MEKDPVCGRIVTPENVAGMSDFQGRRYYFCSPDCRLQFERDPQRFLRRPLEESARRDER